MRFWSKIIEYKFEGLVSTCACKNSFVSTPKDFFRPVADSPGTEISKPFKGSIMSNSCSEAVIPEYHKGSNEILQLIPT